MRQKILADLESGDNLRERRAAVMQARKMNPKRRHKVPDAKCMPVEENSEAVGGSALNKYCLPKGEWCASYGALLCIVLMMGRFRDGALVGDVVFIPKNLQSTS